MTRIHLMLALWLGCLLQIQSAAVFASEPAIALCPDRIIDGVSDQPLVGQAVVIDGENIVAVVPEAEWQGDAVCQRMEGITLLPGLINGHEHPLIYGDDYQGAHLAGSSAYKALLGLSALQSMLQHGWTTVRVMGDADVFYGVLDVRRAIEEGVFDGPRMTGAAHYLSITGGGGDVNYLSPEQRVIADGLIVNGPMEVRKRFARKSSMARTGSRSWSLGPFIQWETILKM